MQRSRDGEFNSVSLDKRRLASSSSGGRHGNATSDRTDSNLDSPLDGQNGNVRADSGFREQIGDQQHLPASDTIISSEANSDDSYSLPDSNNRRRKRLGDAISDTKRRRTSSSTNTVKALEPEPTMYSPSPAPTPIQSPQSGPSYSDNEKTHSFPAPTSVPSPSHSSTSRNPPSLNSTVDSATGSEWGCGTLLHVYIPPPSPDREDSPQQSFNIFELPIPCMVCFCPHGHTPDCEIANIEYNDNPSREYMEECAERSEAAFQDLSTFKVLQEDSINLTDEMVAAIWEHGEDIYPQWSDYDSDEEAEEYRIMFQGVVLDGDAYEPETDEDEDPAEKEPGFLGMDAEGLALSKLINEEFNEPPQEFLEKCK